jgi:hypothetical protein
VFPGCLFTVVVVVAEREKSKGELVVNFFILLSQLLSFLYSLDTKERLSGQARPSRPSAEFYDDFVNYHYFRHFLDFLG